jgi:hypothetical protein
MQLLRPIDENRVDLAPIASGRGAYRAPQLTNWLLTGRKGEGAWGRMGPHGAHGDVPKGPQLQAPLRLPQEKRKTPVAASSH